jgi:hypothetical protein
MKNLNVDILLIPQPQDQDRVGVTNYVFTLS